MWTIWKWDIDGLGTEKLVENCGIMSDVDLTGQHILSEIPFGAKMGVYEVSISERKCVQLLPGIVTNNAVFAPDGKSFLYAVASRAGEVTIYRQLWKDGKLVGTPVVALKVPFAFSLFYSGGNGYDFSRDLSTIVYARPNDHVDLYFLEQR